MTTGNYSIKLEGFMAKHDISQLSEIEKVKNVLYICEIESHDFFVDFLTVISLMKESNLSRSINVSRCRRNVEQDKKDFLWRGENFVALTDKARKDCAALFNDEEIQSSNDFLDESIFGFDGYLSRLAKEVNACYSSLAYDGCGLILRKIIEILIIRCYIAQKKEQDILSKHDPDSYIELKSLIGKITADPVFMMKKDFAVLDKIRQFGNLAAHQNWIWLKKSDFEPEKADINLVIRKMCGIITS